MKLIIIAGLILLAIAVFAVARSRMKRKSEKNKSSTGPLGLVTVTAPAVAAPRIATIPGQLMLTPEQLADDGDDDKYWRRYYS